MQSNGRLCSQETIPAAEGSGRPAMDERIPSPRQQTEEWVRTTSIKFLPSPVGESSSTRSSNAALPKGEKRPRQSDPPPSPSYIQPLPTIETIMSSPDMTRPVYNSLARGEAPPAQNYKTVIHTPKPPNLRILDQNFMRAAELQAMRRRRRANSGGLGNRSRSSTGSSVSTLASEVSTSAASSVDLDRDGYSCPSSSASEVGSEVGSLSSSCLATVSSTPASSSPQFALFPFPQIAQSETLSAFSAFSTPSTSTSNSPTQSFHTSQSTPHTPHHVDSTPSSAYPSPPASPIDPSRRSSSSEEYMAYPSPPPSPSPALLITSTARARDRRSFTFPPPPQPASPHSRPAPPPPETSITKEKLAGLTKATPRPRLARSSSLGWDTPPSSSTSKSRNAPTPIPPAWDMRAKARGLELDAIEFDLGEQRLGGGGLDSPGLSPPSPGSSGSSSPDGEGIDFFPMPTSTPKLTVRNGLDPVEEEMDFDWSMNGGEVVFGAAGLAVSPRLLRGEGPDANWESPRLGLGLYVIDEETENEDDGDRSPVRKFFRR